MGFVDCCELSCEEVRDFADGQEEGRAEEMPPPTCRACGNVQGGREGARVLGRCGYEHT